MEAIFPRLNAFAMDRDRTFAAATIYDEWESVLNFFFRWNMAIPETELELKLGVYLYVQDSTTIPKSVRDLAAEKAWAMKGELKQQEAMKEAST